MRWFGMQSQIDNKGMTLIELIISIAISTIVMLMIVSFINGATKGFRRANDEVNLQMEAQTTINQLNNLALEAMDIYVTTIGENEKIRYIIKISDTEFYIVIHKNDKLYLTQKTSEAGAETIAADDVNDALNLLTEYVDNFEIEINNSTGKVDFVTLKLTLSLGGEEYSITKKARLRNA